MASAAKPVLRNLLQSQTKIDFGVAMVLSIVGAVGYKYGVLPPLKSEENMCSLKQICARSILIQPLVHQTTHSSSTPTHNSRQSFAPRPNRAFKWPYNPMMPPINLRPFLGQYDE